MIKIKFRFFTELPKIINFGCNTPRNAISNICRYLTKMTICVWVQVETIEWTFENIGEEGHEEQLIDLSDYLARRQLDLVINLPMRSGGARRVSSFLTHGYRTRRLAVDYSVPLLTDVKCAKLMVEVT